MGSLLLCVRPIRQNRPILELHSRYVIPLNAVRLQKLNKFNDKHVRWAAS